MFNSEDHHIVYTTIFFIDRIDQLHFFFFQNCRILNALIDLPEHSIFKTFVLNGIRTRNAIFVIFLSFLQNELYNKS